jgi:hypothetical protein
MNRAQIQVSTYIMVAAAASPIELHGDPTTKEKEHSRQPQPVSTRKNR